MTTTTTTGLNAASNEGIVERKGGRESKVAFSRLVDGARSVIASAGISSTLPTVVMEDIGEENEDVDSMRLNPINSNGTSSSNGSSSRTSRTLIAVKWNPPEHDPFATILVGGNIEQPWQLDAGELRPHEKHRRKQMDSRSRSHRCGD